MRNIFFVGLVALAMSIYVVPVVASATTSPFDRINDRLEEIRDRLDERRADVEERIDDIQERLDERRQSLCDRYDDRPYGPSFCDDGGEPAPDAPSILLEVDPDSVPAEGDLVTIAWDVEDADECSASGHPDFDGNRSPDEGANELFIDEEVTLTLVCEGEGGESSESVTVTVEEETPAPVIDFTADPDEFEEDGGTTTLNWVVTNALSCVGTDGVAGWPGGKVTSEGTQELFVDEDASFTLTCTGEGGETVETVEVDVDEGGGGTPAPTLSFEADQEVLTEAGTTTFTWDSENADGCAAQDSWSGEKPVDGTEDVYVEETGTYTLRCAGDGGIVTESILITVEEEMPVPTVDITASPDEFDFGGGTTTLNWVVTNALSCVGTDGVAGWPGGKVTSEGTQELFVDENASFTLTCSGEGGTTTESVEVTVLGGSVVPNILLNEVHYDVATGTEGAYEWVELYNPGEEEVDLSDWIIRDSGASDSLPEGVSIAAGDYLVIVATATTIDLLPEGTEVVILEGNIGNGLGNGGDALYLETPSEEPVDSMSYGSNTDVFDPAAPDVAEGSSIERCPLGADTDTAADWQEQEAPTPGSENECGGGSIDPVPTVDFTADPETVAFEGGTSTLHWEVSDATSCVGTNGTADWPGGKVTSEGIQDLFVDEDTTFTLTCEGPGGETVEEVTVLVLGGGVVLPSIELSVDPTAVPEEGDLVTVDWDVLDADTCTASDGVAGWPGTKATTTGANEFFIDEETTFTLTCENEGGETVAMVSVEVSEATTTPTSTPDILISEVYYDTDVEHGSDADNEWVELYNRGEEPADLTGWILVDTAGASDALPAVVVPAGGYVLIADATTTADFWDIPEDAEVVFLESNIGGGLGNSGDALYLLTPEEEEVDAMSYGTNVDVFDPSAPDVADGHSLARNPVTTDTDTAEEWTDEAIPTPGGPVAERPIEFADSVVISEVYFDVDDTHGAEGANEWIEIHNPTEGVVDLLGWSIGASTTDADVIATTSLILEPGEFIIIAADTATPTAEYWDFGSTTVVSLGATISGGLANGGDEVRLFDDVLVEVDAMSYGSDTSVFDPAPDASEGESLSRDPRFNDTDLGSDWIAEGTPNPGS